MVTIHPDNIGYMVVFQLKMVIKLSIPYSSLSPRQLLKCSPITENWLYSSMPPKTCYIVTVPPGNW